MKVALEEGMACMATIKWFQWVGGYADDYVSRPVKTGR